MRSLTGSQRSTGDVITWLNSDDALLPGAVDALLDCFDADPSLGLVEGDTVVVDGDSRVMHCDRRAGPSRQWIAVWVYADPSAEHILSARDVYERVGGVDRSLHCVMDTELWYRILSNTNAKRLERYCGVHRIHEEAKGLRGYLEREVSGRAGHGSRRSTPTSAGTRSGISSDESRTRWDRMTTGRGRKAQRETQRFQGKPLREVADELVSC